jgi:TPR repeat protein
MRKVKVLFFTADPRLGRPDGEPLELSEDLRQIKRLVRQARFGHLLVFDAHGAARPDDLIDLLEDTDAQVVHFSGHGNNAGLFWVGRGGERPHLVEVSALKRLFRTGHGAVRLAVLSACTSEAAARAIADVVGCALGTLSPIGDKAAITFNSRFYQAVANGYSVHDAHEKACAALQVHRIPAAEYPRLFVRDSTVDPANLVFFKRHGLVPRRIVAAGIACALTIVPMVYHRPVPPEPTVSDIACGAEPGTGISSSTPLQGAAPVTPGVSVGTAHTLASAKAFYRDRNYAAAAAAFNQAASGGNGEAMGCLGYMYMQGRGMAPDSVGGYQLVHKGAEKDDPHAMYALGNAYLAGIGTGAREHLARIWFENAAEAGFPEAMRSLGDLNRQKMNDSSYHAALAWYRKAIAAGCANAKVDIGLMYEFGWAVQRNGVEALKYYQSAAAAGSLRGMWAIGHSYHKGVGVAPDYRLAMEWYKRAAKAGSADGMNSIGILYENGLGVRKSLVKAKRWYKRAAEAGSTLARGNLMRE